MARLLEARVGRFVSLFAGGLSNPVLLDAETTLDAFWPGAMPKRFEDLATPFMAVAADFNSHEEVVIASGPLRSGVAASMAIPGLVRAVPRQGRLLIDGAAVNPLPYDLLAGTAAIVVACDVVGGPTVVQQGFPTPFEAMFGAAHIMQNAITAKMLKARPPDLLIRPPVDGFRVLDFFGFAQILAAAEGAKETIKRDLDRALARA